MYSYIFYGNALVYFHRMSVLEVALIAIVAMVGVALMTLPVIFFIKAKDAWQNIPREVYAPHQQRLAGIRPIYFWIAYAMLNQIGKAFEWLGWPLAERIAEDISLVVFAVVVIYYLIWATRIVRSRADIDTRLTHFARYVIWASALSLLVVGFCLVENFAGK